jgi:methylmalonyl-CoA/ethylmalonyl-CoA epimerase
MNMTRKINQIGIVVRDLEKAVKFYQDFLGFSFNILNRPPESCELHGKTTHFCLKTAFAMAEGVQIEIIQVLEGDTAHTEFLKKHGEGVHHFGYFVEDLEAELSKCAALGIGILSKGEFMGTKWSYLDTEALSGIIHEYIELPKPKIRVKKEKKPDETIKEN